MSLYSDGHFKNKIWVEPFAGGCGLGLYMMEHGLVSKCVFNDYDPRIRDMWKVIAYHSDRLIMELDRLDIGIERFFEAREIANNDSSSTFQRGYNTYILNRCARSGYIDGGAIGGNEQKGNYKIDCRFNIENLVKKIEKIGDLAEAGKIVFTSGHDGCDLIDNLLTQYGVPEEMFLYVDPPYYDKGKLVTRSEWITTPYSRACSTRTWNGFCHMIGILISWGSTPESTSKISNLPTPTIPKPAGKPVRCSS